MQGLHYKQPNCICLFVVVFICFVFEYLCVMCFYWLKPRTAGRKLPKGFSCFVFVFVYLLICICVFLYLCLCVFKPERQVEAELRMQTARWRSLSCLHPEYENGTWMEAHFLINDLFQPWMIIVFAKRSLIGWCIIFGCQGFNTTTCLSNNELRYWIKNCTTSEDRAILQVFCFIRQSTLCEYSKMNPFFQCEWFSHSANYSNPTSTWKLHNMPFCCIHHIFLPRFHLTGPRILGCVFVF